MSAAPMYRRDAPLSSRLAAEEATRSGRADSHRAMVAALVNMHPGFTAGELADCFACPLGVVEVRRRLFDLGEARTVWRGRQRRCGIAGNLQQTWWPTLTQGELFGGHSG